MGYTEHLNKTYYHYEIIPYQQFGHRGVIQRGSEYYHATIDLSLDFCEQWTIPW